MADFLNDWKRTRMCGEFTANDIGAEVIVMGWVNKYRNLGNLIFIDLRDRSGIIQIAFDDKCEQSVLDYASKIRNEYVIAVKGLIRSRGGNSNQTISTGAIEIEAKEVKILSQSNSLPFNISGDTSNVNESLRLKYRYLDLRRSSLQKIFIMRDKITKVTRDYMSKHGFIDVETPFLGKSTPEGARDYLVPSRIHEGCFYALPQSPQLFKQLLMISGFDRYFQIARCFRDEDLRANRQPEFSQIDMEMSFVEKEEDVMEIAEGLIKTIFKECLGLEFTQKFRQITWAEAMSKYGSDKPYTSFGLEINDITDFFTDTTFVVFKNAIEAGGKIKAINLKNICHEFTRKEIDSLVDYAKSCGLKGLSYAMFKQDGTLTSSFVKSISEDELANLKKKLNVADNDLVIIAADKEKLALDTMGNIRVMIAKKHKLVDENDYDILWVTEFPMFEWSDEENRFMAMHHPFTSPKNEDLQLLDGDDLSIVRAKAYDLVINGQEAGGGSIRIFNTDVQEKIFRLLNLSEYDIKERFGYFVEALKYGTPPHGGLAFGLDRLVMLITKTSSIKDVIAFPKVQNASDLMTQAPAEVDEKQLKDLFLKIDRTSHSEQNK